MTTSPRLSRVLLSLAVVWASVGPSLPVFAAEFEAPATPGVVTAPALAPAISPLVSPDLQTAPELPTLPQTAITEISAQALGAQAQAASASISATPAVAATLNAAKLAASQPKIAPMTPERADRTILGRLTQAVGSALLGRGALDWSKIFDSAAPSNAVGIRPLPKPVLPEDFNLGDAPRAPDPKKVATVAINAIDLSGEPTARGAGGVFDAGPRVLSAKTTGSPEEIEASVKEALLKMVDADAAKWGVTGDELKDVHVRYVPGHGTQADTVFAYFEQQKKTTDADGTTRDVVVHGTSLSFTVKLVKNQAVLMSAMAKLYPSLSVATRATKTDEELKQRAEDELRQMPQGANMSLSFVERRIVYHEGAWHAVNLYEIDGFAQAAGIMVAIDIASGQMFAWDSRVGARAASDAAEKDQSALGYPEPAARVAAARAAAPAGAQLIGAAANFLNKSNVWAYRFYVPSTKQVLEVYVNFLGRAQATEPRPVEEGADVAAIDLSASKLLSLSAATAWVKSAGFAPVSVQLERVEGNLEYIFTDARGGKATLLAGIENHPSFQGAANAPQAAVSGVAQARAEANDHRPTGKPVLVDLATPYLKFTIDDKPGMTDTDGKFTGNGKSFVATVESRWARINDENGKPLRVNVSLDPSKPNVVVINPTQNDEGSIDQVNMLIWINRIHDWWSQRLRTDARLDKQIPVNVNINDECNAYYTPGRPSLNFFHSSEECSDTGRPGVGMHEYGHFVDDQIGGITNGGMSEGWGDIGSMFILGTPIIGEGFLKHRDPSWIRHGENTYQYNENDEVHDQGQAWMGFAWKLRKSLIASMGEAAGTAEAEALIVPTMFAKASDIPSQMAQVLLNAMDRDGKIRHEKEIRAAARAHGIELPQAPGIAGGLAGAASSLVGLVMGGSSVSLDEVASETFGGAQSLVPENFGQRDDGAVVTKTFSLKAGRAARDDIRAKLLAAYQYRSGEYHDLGFNVQETKGWRGSEFVITVTGSEKSVTYLSEQLRRISLAPTR